MRTNNFFKILGLVVITFTLIVGCNSENENENENINNNYITITTDTPIPVGTKLSFIKIRGREVWIDLNNDGVNNKEFEYYTSYPGRVGTGKKMVKESKTIRIYGNVKYLKLDGDDYWLTKMLRENNMKIASIEVSSDKLEELSVYKCGLTKLKLSNAPNLIDLDCYNNNLTNLDISHNNKLKYLGCDNNNLTSLDISNNNKLEGLSCDNNNLTNLDISNNKSLRSISCENNKLTYLDLSQHNNLENVDVQGNNDICVKVNNIQLTYRKWAEDKNIFKLSCE